MKYCKCKKWIKEFKLSHHDETGKFSWANIWKFCPWCSKKLLEL